MDLILILKFSKRLPIKVKINILPVLYNYTSRDFAYECLIYIYNFTDKSTRMFIVSVFYKYKSYKVTKNKL